MEKFVYILPNGFVEEEVDKIFTSIEDIEKCAGERYASRCVLVEDSVPLGCIYDKNTGTHRLPTDRDFGLLSEYAISEAINSV